MQESPEHFGCLNLKMCIKFYASIENLLSGMLWPQAFPNTKWRTISRISKLVQKGPRLFDQSGGGLQRFLQTWINGVNTPAMRLTRDPGYKQLGLSKFSLPGELPPLVVLHRG